MSRGAYAEAIRVFERGLTLVARLPDSRQRMQHELELTASLGRALLLTRGFGAPAGEEKFTHALRFCELLGVDARHTVLAGLRTVLVSRTDREATAVLLGNMLHRP